MPNNTNIINISNFTSEPSNRFDVDYVKNYINKKDEKYIKFTDLFKIVDKRTIDISEIEDPIKYCQISDVDDCNNKKWKLIDFDNETPQLNDYYRKIEKGDIFLPQKGNILISKVRPYLRKFVLVDEEDIYYTTSFIELKPIYNSLISYYFLYYTLTNDINIAARQGKGYPTIKEDDLIYLRIYKEDFDSFIKNINNRSKIEKINSLYCEIIELKKKLIDEDEIIEKIIVKEANIKLIQFNLLKNKNQYISTLSHIIDNIDLRCSVKFNRPAKDELYLSQKEAGFITIKDILKKDGELGKSVSPSDYSEENTEKYYISMADISSFYVDYDNLKEVSEKYYKDNLNKKVNVNDILITRSGEGGIGKVAFVDKDINAIFCDFIIRLSLNENYNPKFLYYYLRTTMFQYFVEVNKKGLGNNTNIFPNQIKYAMIPNISLSKQKNICFKIEDAISKNNKVNEEIANMNSLIKKCLDE